MWKSKFGASVLSSGSWINILAKDRQRFERPESATFNDFCLKLSSFAVTDTVTHNLRQMSLRDAYHVSMSGDHAVRFMSKTDMQPSIFQFISYILKSQVVSAKNKSIFKETLAVTLPYSDTVHFA